MASISSWIRNALRRSPSPPRKFSSTGFRVISNDEKLEEENWDWYTPDLFYPVRIGEIFQSRYQVLGKLGYGSRSTAWLSRDLREHKYVTLKICKQDSPPIRRELAAYRYLDMITTNNVGALLVRELLDAFNIKGRTGEHQCLVHEPLGMSMETLRQLCPGRKLPTNILKPFLIQLLHTLDFLHTDAKLIHADLQARNVHLRIEDHSILEHFQQAELNSPSPRKIDVDRIIYESRGLRRPNRSGRPVLCDFGEARFGKSLYTDQIQPFVYRAPEIILDIPWTYSVDIWNVGVMIWDIFENKYLFNAKDIYGERSNLYHIAEMVALLGLPPLSYLKRSGASWEYFNESTGKWKGAIEVPNMTLEGSEEILAGEEKAVFLDFMGKFLNWIPEERQTAKQLLNHPWLCN